MANNYSARFASMSAFSAVLIVLLHSSVAPAGGSWGFYMEQIVGVVCRIAVPWFFLAAGYFLARHFGRVGWWGGECRKRISSLLVPMWIWLVIGFLVALAVHVAMGLVGYHLQQADAIDRFGWKTILTLTGCNFFVNMGPLWFVRTLFVFVCLSPIIAWGNKCVSLLRLLLLAVLYAVSVGALQQNSTAWTFFEYGLSLRGLLYFAIGAHLQQYPIDISSFRKWVVGVAGVAAIGLLGLYLAVPSCTAYVDLVLVPVVMFVVYNGVCVGGGGLARFSSYAFPVYLMHGIMLTAFSCALGVVGIRTTSLQSLWWHFGRAAFAIVGAMLCTWALRKWLPRVAKVVFGGR